MDKVKGYAHGTRLHQFHRHLALSFDAADGACGLEYRELVYLAPEAARALAADLVDMAAACEHKRDHETIKRTWCDCCEAFAVLEDDNRNWCADCVENEEPPEPDYDAPSAAERLELSHRAKRETR